MDTADEEPVAAGGFSAWLGGMRRTLDGGEPVAVPCGGCTGCCRSSQFVHIGPDEVDTLAHVPAALVFPAPRLPAGNVLLGYDEHGHCPMLVEGGCSIYDHRPRTCRTYDCRVFPAAGVELEDDDKLPIALRARRWQFDFPAYDDRVRHVAVRAAATFVEAHPEVLGEDGPPPGATQRAVLAVRLHDAFLGCDDETGAVVVVDPEPEEVRVVLGRRRG